MTDEKLTELAARAYLCAGGQIQAFTAELWEPLIHDAHAFRLATRLSMMINVEYGETEVAAHPSLSDGHSIVELHNGDALAATRRAIVRCAAGDYA